MIVMCNEMIYEYVITIYLAYLMPKPERWTSGIYISYIMDGYMFMSLIYWSYSLYSYLTTGETVYDTFKEELRIKE